MQNAVIGLNVLWETTCIFEHSQNITKCLLKLRGDFFTHEVLLGIPSHLSGVNGNSVWNSQLGLSYHQEVKFSLVVMSYVSCNLRITGKIRDNSRLSVFVVWQIYQLSVVLNKLLLFRLNLISVSKNS